METVYIAIEKNTEVFELYKGLWEQLNVSGIMVGSMTEAIEEVAVIDNSKTQHLYFVSISSDDIDYLPQLPLLCEATDAPILIATSNYNDDEHHEAIDRGAFFYGQFCENHDKNIRAVVAYVNRYYSTMGKNSPKNVIVYGGVAVSFSQRTVYKNRVKVDLTTTEFDLLRYFFENRGSALSFEQIYDAVWREKPNNSHVDAVKNIVKHVRKKLSTDDDNSIIENIRGFGYKIPIYPSNLTKIQ